MYALPELGRLDDVNVVTRWLFLPSILFIFGFSAFYFSKITKGMLKALGFGGAKPARASSQRRSPRLSKKAE